MSVIIPSRNRVQQLDRCLAALARQQLDGTFEVIVVDDGGDDPAQPVVEQHAHRLPTVVYRQANRGPAAARNAGAALSSGRYLAFTDNDCTPEPGWLAALLAALDQRPGALVAGRTVNGLTDNLFAEASQSLVAYLDRAKYVRNGDLAFVTSNNLAVAAEGFKRIGGFDASFPLAAAEDRDFTDRWRLAGGSIHRDPSAIVVHHHQMGLGGFWRQHVGYGRGARHLHAARASRGQPALRVEAPGFYLDMVRHPLGDEGARWRRAGCAALVGLSQVATAVGFTAEGRVGSTHRVPAR